MEVRSGFRVLVGAAVVVAAVVLAAAAQAPVGVVVVVVRDDAGAVLGGVTVTLRGRTSPATRQAQTGADGVARFDGVGVGGYEVRAALASFRPAGPVVIDVRSGETVRTAMTLSLASTGDAGRHGVLVETPVRIDTTLGSIRLAVAVTQAPATAANFLRYVDAGLYDGGRFHLASGLPGEAGAPMLIQAGVNPARESERFDPVPLERTGETGLRHRVGAVAMARGPGPDSARAEFFILLADAPSLDHGGDAFADRQGTAVFGRVVEGLDVVARIHAEPRRRDRLSSPVTIVRAMRVR